MQSEYCQHECCAHKPWMLFHTPLGDIKIGWRHRVINLTFMTDFIDFSIDIFKDKGVTKYVEGGERTIHAYDARALTMYLERVREVVLPNKKRA